MPFWCQVRVEGVDEENAKLLEDAGCVSVSAGIESGSEQFRRKMLHRAMSNEALIKAFHLLKKTKMQVSANSIIGFPEETRELIFETIEINRIVNPDNIMIHVFNPYRGTSLYDISVKEGYIPQDHMAGDYRVDFTLDMPQLSREEVLGLHRTFALYCKFPKEMWAEIRLAEKLYEAGNKKFEELSTAYRAQFMEKKPRMMH